VIELYPSGIGLTMTKSSFHGRMSSARSIDLPGSTNLHLGSRLVGQPSCKGPANGSNITSHLAPYKKIALSDHRSNEYSGAAPETETTHEFRWL
jgi:hypothetical protein